MAKLLDLYKQRREEYLKQIEAEKFPQEKLVLIPELNYRIEVLETFRTFCKNAPITRDTKAIGYHYQLVDAYIRFLQSECRFGPRTDDAGLKKRQTASATVDRVAEEYRRRFASFSAKSDDMYKKNIGEIVNNVLAVWIQLRDAYVSIK